MRNSLGKTTFILILLTLVILAGIGFWLSLETMSGDHGEDRSGSDTDSPPDLRRIVTAKQMAESRGDSQALPQHQSRSKKLIGTWTKQRIGAIEPVFQSLGGDDWHLTVTFTDDGRFVWDSRRPGMEGGMIDDSLTGKYSIERGFLIAYRFDEPSVEALERLTMLFAFWPNQLLGKHTFRFEGDCLILGHDGEKIWFYLKRNGLESNRSTHAGIRG
jgi:hypothetical protein